MIVAFGFESFVNTTQLKPMYFLKRYTPLKFLGVSLMKMSQVWVVNFFHDLSNNEGLMFFKLHKKDTSENPLHFGGNLKFFIKRKLKT